LKPIVLYIICATAISARAQDLKTYEISVPGTAIKFKMVAVPGGSFTMGSPPAGNDRETDEGPQKKVLVSAFWIGEHEVTFAAWDAFFRNMEIPQTKNISVDAISRPTPQYIDLTWGMGREANNPTNSMSQQAALMYCKWLYEKTGVFYRLPTEAEWEYACKGGKENFPMDARTLSQYGYFNGNSGGKYHLVKSLKPNAWGLYDMLGNLSEWTLDQYDAALLQNLASGVKDPVIAPASKYPKVVKGGSYLDASKELRCSNRIPSEPAWNKRDPQVPKSKWWLTDGMGIGFRIVRPGVQPSKEEIEKFFAQYLK
jgi:formylglycine-generating enzyme required for sulfatase activity